MTPDFKGFSVEPVSPAESDLGARKIVAWSTQPFGTNASLRAWIGDQEMTGITVDQFGLSFQGLVAAVPDQADTLKIQMFGDEKFDTGLTAEEDGGIA